VISVDSKYWDFTDVHLCALEGSTMCLYHTGDEQMSITTTPRYLDEKELAAMTGMSLSRLRQDRQARRGIPYHKVGRSVRYRLDDVLAFLESCRVETEPASYNQEGTR